MLRRIHNLAKFSSGRGVRSIWISRPWLLARTFTTTSRRSSVTPQFESLPPGNRLPSIYTIILALGVGLTAYGAYNIYEFTTVWPEAIRGDLREGIKYRNQGDLLLSIQYFKKAWEKSKSLPLNLFKPDPLLKTSGIAIVLAGVLENDGKLQEAYNIYNEAVWQLQSAYLNLHPDAPHPEIGTETLKLLTGPERMRVAALAYKLGCMASELGKADEEEEKWLTCAVNAVLIAVMEASAGSGMDKVVQVPSGGEHDKTGNMYFMAQDLRLPVWSRMHDLAAPFEALGTFYSKHGNSAYALPLYLQAVSILIPPPPIITSAEDRCRGAQLMGRISGTILTSDLHNSPAERITQATSWAQKALDIVILTRESSSPSHPINECELAYIALLFNMATMRRLSGDEAKARELYEASMEQSKAMGLESVNGYAREALQELDLKKA